MQNDFAQLSLFIDDFPINVSTAEQLNGKKVEIPFGFEEVEDEDGEIHEVYYTSLNASEDEYETVKNELVFSKNNQGILSLNWTGYVQDYTGQTNDDVKFVIQTLFEDFDFEDDDFF